MRTENKIELIDSLNREITADELPTQLFVPTAGFHEALLAAEEAALEAQRESEFTELTLDDLEPLENAMPSRAAWFASGFAVCAVASLALNLAVYLLG